MSLIEIASNNFDFNIISWNWRLCVCVCGGGGGGGKDLLQIPPSFAPFHCFCESSEFSVQNFLLVKLDKKNLYRSNIDPLPTIIQHAKIHESATNKTTKLFTRNKTPAAHPRPSPPAHHPVKTIKHKNKTVAKTKNKKAKTKSQNQGRTHLVTEIKSKHVGYQGNEPTTVKLQQKSPVLPSSKLALYPSCKWQSHFLCIFCSVKITTKIPNRLLCARSQAKCS